MAHLETDKKERQGRLDNFFKKYIPSWAETHAPTVNETKSVVTSQQKSTPLQSSSALSTLSSQQVSQIDLNSSPPATHGRRRLTKDGLLVVPSSEDEEEEAEEVEEAGEADADGVADSDTSLEEIGSLLAPAPEPVQKKKRRKNVEIRHQPLRTRRVKADAAATLADVSRYKFSMASLVDQAAEDRSSEADVAQVRQALLNQQKRHRAAQQLSDGDVSGRQRQLVALMEDTEAQDQPIAGMDRLKNAMQRTEAMGRGVKWSFFGHGQRCRDASKQETFPVNGLQNTEWHSLLKNPKTRPETFASGIVADLIVKSSPLADEVTLWTVFQVPVERKDAVRRGYVNALKASSTQLQSLVSRQTLDDLLGRIGASGEALDLNRQIEPRTAPSDDSSTKDWSMLLRLINLLTEICHCVDSELLPRLLQILLRLLLDTQVIESIEIVSAIGECLESTCARLTSSSWEETVKTLPEVVAGYTTRTTFREQLLRNSPATSPRSRQLRHRLALHFLLTPRVGTSLDLDDTASLRALISDRLTHAPFVIDQKTDYAELAAMTSIFEVAIADGMPAPGLSPAETRDFENVMIDLTTRLKNAFAKIQDTGASHMSRTEAKENLDRVHVRLKYSLSPRIAKGMLLTGQAGDGEASAEDKEKFRRYFGKTEEK